MRVKHKVITYEKRLYLIEFFAKTFAGMFFIPAPLLIWAMFRMYLSVVGNYVLLFAVLLIYSHVLVAWIGHDKFTTEEEEVIHEIIKPE